MTTERSVFSFVPSDEVRCIRERIDHPVLDADGHQLEYLPLFLEVLGEVAGPSVVARYNRLRVDRGIGRVGPYWTLPSENTLDRASAMLPKLMYSRLDEIGIDYALMYPSLGLSVLAMVDDEVRQAAARALNIMYAEVYDGFRDRLEPVAVIPNFTPEEAVAELRYAITTLGLKSVVMASFIPRTRPGPDGAPVAWLDTIGHDSVHDYDPLWAACVELGVAPSFHSTGFGHGTRMSRSNYVYNHVGHFGWAQEGICRSLTLGGVPKRFPGLRFAFLEGGVSWGCQLLADLVGHYEKRNIDEMHRYDPTRIDNLLLRQLFEEFAVGRMASHPQTARALRAMTYSMDAPTRDDLDDFAEGGITSIQDIVDVFTRQYVFGCEADDPLNALAFSRRMLPADAQLNAVMASDIGHWDVPDVREVVPEAWELVENGALDPGQFKEFSFTNLTRMLTDVNPGFFDGTVVEGDVAKFLAEV